MTVTADPTYAPPDAFRLKEATAHTVAGGLNEDGTVDIVVIRPTIGRGKGRHLYEADMLAQNAHKFRGWKMYNNHLSEAARRQLGGLPRPIEHQGGRVLEAWWNPDYPAEGRYGQGAVMATVRPVGIARQLIQEDPGIMEASINARATGVRPVTRGGVKCWLVEGIEDSGSIDWVSEGGAGGRVASLVEAMYSDEEDEMSRLDDLTDEELTARLRRDRPALVEALVQEPGRGPGATKNEGADVAKPVDTLREALESDEGKQLLQDFTKPLVEAQVEERIEAEREFIIAEANAEADRRVELRDLRDIAHELIEAAALPDSMKTRLKGQYALKDNEPTASLDVVEAVAADGSVEKTTEQVLREAVEADITESKTALREAAEPTRVTGQGGSGGDGAPRGGKSAQPLFAKQLQEAGVDFGPAKKDDKTLED